VDGIETVRTIYRPPSAHRQASQQLGLATLRAGTSLSIIFVFFGIAAAFVPGSLEQRIGNLLFFGLIPAAGFHAASIVLGRLLAFSSELCEMIAASCLRWLARAGKNFVILVSHSVSYASARYLIVPAHLAFSKITSLSRSVCRSINRGCWHADKAIFEFSCLLIRSGARSILRMQACCRRGHR
jgi:hypothetical protein